MEERPAIVQWLVKQDCGWNMEHIILLLVGIEHVILLLKASLAAIIPDLPKEVADDEFRRKKIESMALEDLRQFKIEGKYETYDDMITRL